jgi:hypothetical protein
MIPTTQEENPPYHDLGAGDLGPYFVGRVVFTCSRAMAHDYRLKNSVKFSKTKSSIHAIFVQPPVTPLTH